MRPEFAEGVRAMMEVKRLHRLDPFDAHRVAQMTGDELEVEALRPPQEVRMPDPPLGSGLVVHFGLPTAMAADKRYRALYGVRPGKGAHRVRWTA